MKAWTRLSADEIEALAPDGVRVRFTAESHRLTRGERRGQYRHQFALATDGGRYARTSSRGRRLPHLCWHGHRDFMAALFMRDPEARLLTAIADYRGAESFAEQFEATGQRNIGGYAAPVEYRHACACEVAGPHPLAHLSASTGVMG